MCKKDQPERTRTADVMILAGVGVAIVSVGVIGGVSNHIETEKLLGILGVAGLIVATMLIKSGTIIKRIDRIELITRDNNDQLTGQLVEDPDNVTRLGRRRV